MVEWTKPRPLRIGEIYGYTVLIVTLITFLFSIDPLVTAIYALADPFCAWRGSSDLASFQKYRRGVLGSTARISESHIPIQVPDDENIRQMMEEEKNHRIAVNRHRARGDLTTNSTVMFTCIVLFAWHWIWLRRITRNNGGVAERSSE